MKILKPGIKGQYYRFICPNCHCEFIADISEIGHVGCGELIAFKFNVKCPDCQIDNTMDGIECDEDGNKIIRPNNFLEVAIN